MKRLMHTGSADLTRWTSGVVWIALIATLCLAAPAVFALDLMLIHEGEEEGKMAIGGDLDVHLSNGASGAYTVRLVDESNQIVASTIIQLSQGGDAGRRLWTRTGVVGCDPGAVHDPDAYLFESFAEAEELLEERTFNVEVYQGILFPAAQSPLEEMEISLVLPDLDVQAFPADSSGCFRTVFLEGEDLYLSIEHYQSSPQLFRNFVVQARYFWTAGTPLLDVRPNGSEVITVPAGQPSLHLLWSPPPSGGGDPPPFYLFDIVLRPGVDPNPAFDPISDFFGGRPAMPGGGTLPECKTGCIPP